MCILENSAHLSLFKMCKFGFGFYDLTPEKAKAPVKQYPLASAKEPVLFLLMTHSPNWHGC